MELTKREKKLARELIDKSIENEFETGLKEAEAIMAEWKKGRLTGRIAFHKLRDHLNDFRRYLARRYDGLRESDYFDVITAIFKDGYLTEEDIKDFSEQAKQEMKRRITYWKEVEEIEKKKSQNEKLQLDEEDE